MSSVEIVRTAGEPQPGVYLLHFVPRYKHAQHYMGYADDIPRRVYEHEFGQSAARLTTAAAAAGVRMFLARTWPGGDRTLERKLKGGMNAKRTGSLARLCPFCKGEKELPCQSYPAKLSNGSFIAPGQVEDLKS